MKFLLPQGIGDSVWALHKIESVAMRLGLDEIHVCLSGNEGVVDSRALDFVRRFSFVSSARMRSIGILHSPAWREDGCWNYVDDGIYEIEGERYCALIPNAALEHGIRLEDWLPHHRIDWDIFSRFHQTPKECRFGQRLREDIGPYAVFYPGPLGGNTVEGHNRGMLWHPSQWLALGNLIHEAFGLAIVCVGARYDRGYFDCFLAPLLPDASCHWVDMIGETSIGELYSVTSNACFCISYQAGVGIVSTYLGTPTAIFWRPQGDSISSHGYLSFSEAMASAWVPPSILASGGHLPLIYGKHDENYIYQEIRNRQWVQ